MSNTSVLESLTQPFLSHLREEEDALRALLESLKAVRLSLLKNDLDAFHAALLQQQQSAELSESVRAKRDALLEEMAPAAGIPVEAITLSKLATAIGNEAGQAVEESRHRLKELAAEVNQLNRINAAVVHQAADLTQQVLNTLTNTVDDGGRYGATGDLETPVSSPIVQASG